MWYKYQHAIHMHDNNIIIIHNIIDVATMYTVANL